MKFSVIGIGKIKEKWMKAGIAEYTKRLSGMGRVEFIEQGEERVPDNPSPADITKALDREAEKLLKYVPSLRDSSGYKGKGNEFRRFFPLDGKKDGNRKQPFLFPYRRSLW